MRSAVNGKATKPDVERATTRTLRKRIGSTIFEVSVHFSETNTETLEDKILRLMEREVKNA